ncbi:MAG: hypothetical protein WB580_04095 [Candidatus Binataceae bacterium]
MEDLTPEPAARTNCIAIGASANAAIKHPPVLVASAANPQNRASFVTSDPPWKPQWAPGNVWRDGFKMDVVRFADSKPATAGLRDALTQLSGQLSAEQVSKKRTMLHRDRHLNVTQVTNR